MGVQRKRLLLVGLGRWGKIFLHNILANPAAELAGVVTSRPEEMKAALPAACRIFPTTSDALAESWDGVILATPPQVHGPQLQLVMEAGIPALVEKPLCLNLNEAEALLALEKELNARVLVDHVQLFHAGYERLWQEAHSAEMLEIESEGGGPGPFRDYSALWDYGAHDLSMILDLMGEEPLEINCRKTEEKLIHSSLGANFETRLRFRKGNAVFRSGTLFPEKKRSFHVRWGKNQGRAEDFPRPRLLMQNESEKEAKEFLLDHEPKPLIRVLNVFLAGLDKTTLDRRWGLKLGVQVVRALEGCEKSLGAKS